MNLKRRFFFLGFVLPLFSWSQNNQHSFFKYSSFGAQYYYGTSIGHTFKRIRDSRPYSAELYYQRQVNVSPFWNHTKRLPQWGLGMSATHSGSKEVGTIICLYPFIKLPLYTVGPLEGNLRFGFGAGWIQKIYDKVTNPENLLLSQRISSHANISFQNEVRLSARHFLNFTAMFYHVSNAKTSSAIYTTVRANSESAFVLASGRINSSPSFENTDTTLPRIYLNAVFDTVIDMKDSAQ